MEGHDGGGLGWIGCKLGAEGSWRRHTPCEKLRVANSTLLLTNTGVSWYVHRSACHSDRPPWQFLAPRWLS